MTSPNEGIFSAGLSGADNIVGTSENDTLLGYDGQNAAVGGDDRDTLSGGLGNDHLYGDADDDILYGGNGLFNPEDGDDLLFGGLGNDTLYGNGGNDVLAGGAGSDYLHGGIGSDIIYGASNTSDGPDGGDVIYGGSGADSLFGGDGADTIFGGNNIYDPNDLADTIDGGAGNDIIYGNGGDDVLLGGAGDDTLYGGLGDNTLTGGEGQDVFFINDTSISDATDGESVKDDPTSGPQAAAETITGANGNTIVITDFGDDDVIRLNTPNTNFRFSDLQIEQDATNNMIRIIELPDSDTRIKLILSNINKAINQNDIIVNGQAITSTTPTVSTPTAPTAPTNQAPVIATAIEDSPADVDAAFTLDISNNFSDPNGDAITLSATLADGSALPAWLSFNATTGVFSGTPAATDKGYLSVKVTASDSSLSTQTLFAIAVDSFTGLGTSGDDNINGAAGFAYDQIHAGAGNDTINGGNGPDTIYGGDGNDSINGSHTQDYLYGGAGDDYVSGDTNCDYIEGGAGADTLVGGSGDSGNYDIFAYTSLTDSTTSDTDLISDFTQGEDKIWLGAVGITSFTDLTITNDGISTFIDHNTSSFQIKVNGVIALNSTDFIFGEFKNLGSVYNSNSSENYTGTALGDFIWANSGGDTVSGGNGNDTLFGEVHDDTLYGGNGDDYLNGGGQNDYLDGGAGQDSLVGGGHTNYFAFSDLTHSTNIAADVISDFNLGSDRIILSGLGINGLGDLAITNDGTNTYVGHNSSTFQIQLSGVVALGANDFVFGNFSYLTHASENYTGSSLGDYVLANNGWDIINGADGNDTLYGQTHDDTVYGGDGDDYVNGGGQVDYIDGQAGRDTLVGEHTSTGYHDIFAFSDLTHSTNIAADLISDFTQGEDIISLDGLGINSLADLTISNNGTNTFVDHNASSFQIELSGVIALSANDFVFGELRLFTGGWDNYTGTVLGDYVRGAHGNDVLNGANGNDTIYGETHDDVLNGDAGNDTLNGGGQNDTLNGGAGNDTLTGGSQDDTFIFDQATAGHDDNITDMNTLDTIAFSDAVFNFATANGAKNGVTLTDDVDIFDVASFAGGSFAAGGGATFLYDTVDGQIWYDADGDGGGGLAVLIATIDNFASYTYDVADFVGIT